MKALPLGGQVTIAFAVVCLMLLTIGGLSFFSLRIIAEDHAEQFTLMNEVAQIDGVAQKINQIQASVLRQVMVLDTGEIQHFDQLARENWSENVAALNKYRAFISNPREKFLYDTVIQQQKLYWEQTEQVLALGLANRDAMAMERIRTRQSPAYDNYLRAIRVLSDYAETEAKETAQATSRFISRIKLVVDLLVVAAIFIALGTARFVDKMVRQLREDNQVLQNEIEGRRSAQQASRLLNSAVEQSKEAITVTDAQLNLPGPKILFVNPAFTVMTGYTAQEAIGQTPRMLQGPRTDRKVLNRLRENLTAGQVFEGSTTNYRKDGVEFDMEWQIAPIRNDESIVTHFVAIQRDVTTRNQADEKLRQSEEKFRQLAENVSDVFWITSPDMKQLLYVSPAYERVWGRPLEGACTRPTEWADAILSEDRLRVFETFARLEKQEASVTLEFRIARPDGEIRWINTRGFQVCDKDGNVIRLTGTTTDVTERKRLESQLIHSQKMETVGKLAGGVAHEFNSILTAIIGHSDLMLRDFSPESPFSKSALEINQAAIRAAKLTRQLLAFGRKQILQPEILDVNRILANMEGMIRRLMGNETTIFTIPTTGLHSILADLGQIEQVIMNIVMNARDAMPNGGKLTFETANVSFEAESIGRYPELKPGDYVMLAITDTGAGLSDQAKARAFEPFFSTKAVGEGTGLGLSTCYGIVKQSGGHISVYSEEGRGASFKIYLPQAPPSAKQITAIPLPPDLPGGSETILLVEDDPTLLKLSAVLLRRLGYTVLPASNGIEALSLKQQRDVGHIDLLFTDVVMPHMSGKELADRVRSLYPHTKILFTSSYTENAIIHQGVLDNSVALLQKPFTPSALAYKLRQVLDCNN